VCRNLSISRRFVRLGQKARITRSVFLPWLIDWRFFVISFVRTENEASHTAVLAPKASAPAYNLYTKGNAAFMGSVLVDNWTLMFSVWLQLEFVLVYLLHSARPVQTSRTQGCHFVFFDFFNMNSSVIFAGALRIFAGVLPPWGPTLVTRPHLPFSKYQLFCGSRQWRDK